MPVRRYSTAIAATVSIAALSTAIDAGAAQAQDGGRDASSSVKVRAVAAAAAVLRTPRTMETTSTAGAVSLTVRYQCRNPKGTTHYLTARLAQDNGMSYVVGLRGDTGGLVRATCTGRPVTAVLQLQRSAYADPAAGLVDGPASLDVGLEARATDGAAGGWYTTTGHGATSTSSVQVVVR